MLLIKLSSLSQSGDCPDCEREEDDEFEFAAKNWKRGGEQAEARRGQAEAEQEKTRFPASFLLGTIAQESKMWKGDVARVEAVEVRQELDESRSAATNERECG